MRWVWPAIFLLAPVTSSWANSITLSDKSDVLPNIAVATAEILIDAGLPIRKISKDHFVVEARGFHCDEHSNQTLGFDSPLFGLARVKCRVDAEDVMNTTTGQLFGDARAMLAILRQIQDKNGNMQFSGCASGGYCGTFAKAITCTIHTDTESSDHGARWECTFMDDR